MLVLTEICTREIQNTSVTWGALQIPCCWAYLQGSENKATPQGSSVKIWAMYVKLLPKQSKVVWGPFNLGKWTRITEQIEILLKSDLTKYE